VVTRPVAAIDNATGLLLRATLAADEGDRAAAWARWARDHDLDAIDALGGWLLPLVHRRVPQAALGSALGRLRGIHRYHWTRNQLLASRLDAAFRSFAQDGVLPVMVSGPAVATRWYPDAGARPVEVVDLLLDVPSIPRAVARLRALGWLDADHTVSRGLRLSGTRALTTEPACRVALHPARRDEPAPAEALAVGATEARALDAEATLVAVCGAGWRFREWSTPRWIPDAALLLQSAGATLDWARVATEAAAWGAAATVHARLADLRAAGLAPVPDAALDRLGRVGPTALERVEALAARCVSRARAEQLGVRRRTWLRAAGFAWDRALAALRGGEAAARPASRATTPAARQ
jgi:hypothetical protein